MTKVYVPAEIVATRPGGQVRVHLLCADADYYFYMDRDQLIEQETVEPTESDIEMAVRYLSQYRAARREIKELKERRMALVEIYAMPSAIRYTAMPKARSAGRDLSEMSVKLEEYQGLIEKKLRKLLELEEEIYSTVEKLEDQTSRRVLKAYYIDGKAWREVAQMIPCTQRAVYNYRERALKEIIKFIKT